MTLTDTDIAAALANAGFADAPAALTAHGFNLTGWADTAVDIAIRQWTMERGGLDLRVDGYDSPNYRAALERWSSWEPSPSIPSGG